MRSPHHHHHQLPQPDDNPDRIQPTSTMLMGLLAGGQRKKSSKGTTGVRPWLLMDSTGRSQVVEAGKHVIMRRTGLPARDLRILDPVLMYPSTVLGRERAIVINLEHIKAIVTAHEVLLLNSPDPSLIPFVDELKRRLSRHHQATVAPLLYEAASSRWTRLCDLAGDEPSPRDESLLNSPSGFGHDDQVVKDELCGSRMLPFEFVALEACLESACTCLENEAKRLEEEAYPALDKLSSKISNLNLERVRQIKSRLVGITGRVQKVRDEVEQLVDDDEDMAEMYLSEKWVNSSSAASTPSSMNEPLVSMTVADQHEDEVTEDDDEIVEADDMEQVSIHRGDGHTNTTTSNKQLDVQELEMLLEAYFVQIDSALNKLSTLREYVDDTEDYIMIMLDDKQNQLLQMGVILSTATLVISTFIVLAGIMGMNIKIELFKEDTKTGMPKWLWTVGGGSIGSLFIFVIAIAWFKHTSFV